MLLTLVLAVCVARAAPEWVQISQQHYRKTERTHAHPAAFYPENEEKIDDEAAFHLDDDKRNPSDAVSHTFDLNYNNRKLGDEVTHIFDHNDERKKPNDGMFYTFHTHGKRKKLSGDIMSHSFHPNDERRRPVDEVTHTLHSNDERKPSDRMPNIFYPNDEKRRPSDEITQTFHTNDERIKPSDDVIDTLHPNNEKKRPNNDAHDLTEIKPNHYEDIGKLKLTNSNRIYLNHSVPAHNWDIDLDDINFDRNSKVKPNMKPKFNIENGEEIENKPGEVASGYSNNVKNKEVSSATIERVANKGNVKRVQLSESPVKSPSTIDAMSPIRRNVIKQHGPFITDDEFSDEPEIKFDVHTNKQKDNVTSKNHGKFFFGDAERTTMWKYDNRPTLTTEPIMTIQKHPQTHDFNNIKRMEHKVSSTENISNDDEYEVSVEIINNNAVYIEHKNNGESFKSEMPNVVKKNEKIYKLEELDSEEVTTNTSPINNDLKRQKARPTNKTNANGGNDKNEEIKVNTMESIMKFVKVVADTISKNTKRGVNGKVEYLNELKETLLSSIRSHVDATWPDETSRGARRRSRSPRGRGHVEFPSSESSLMTISFLTFAVFLIKLVLQVIQTYKNKAMMVAPLVVATAGRTLPKLR